jgi:hypothetical protein
VDERGTGPGSLVSQALAAKLEPLLILDYGNPLYDSGDKPLSPQALGAFSRYAVFVVQHFKGRVHMYEMWNEWNGMVGNTHRGSPQDYARFVRAVYPAVKAADPSAIFIAGSVGGLKLDWLSGMLTSGGVGFFDALSIHPYNFDTPTRTADTWAHDMFTTEAIIRRYTNGHDVPLYITEMGWPTYSGTGGSSPQEAALFLAQMFLLARTMPFLNGIWWYDFRDDGWNAHNKEDNFGLVDPNLKPKKAFGALSAIAQLIRDATTVEVVPTADPAVRAVRFTKAGGQQVMALWDRDPASTARTRVVGNVTLHIANIELDNPVVQAKSNAIDVDLTSSPILISGSHLSISGQGQVITHEH